jgi:benzoyl-CoA reductase/2-hydroxyglutaryl-CoA dehydratase subunit BcrC/BadD/HgdB
MDQEFRRETMHFPEFLCELVRIETQSDARERVMACTGNLLQFTEATMLQLAEMNEVVVAVMHYRMPHPNRIYHAWKTDLETLIEAAFVAIEKAVQ